MAQSFSTLVNLAHSLDVALAVATWNQVRGLGGFCSDSFTNTAIKVCILDVLRIYEEMEET